MEPLQEIGLTERESKVYLALLELGSTTTGPLIKKSEVPNSKIYEILESLNKKALVSHIIKGKTKYFQASDPNSLLSLVKEKERKLLSILPRLKEKQLLAKEKQSVELFTGIKSIRNLFLTIIENTKKGENWYGFSTGKTSTNEEIKDFYEWWGAKKYNSGLKDHLLISSEYKSIFEKAHKEKLSLMKNILKYSKISFPGDVAIFKNKVIILNWEDTSAILITSQHLTNQYLEFFLKLWNNAKDPFKK